MSNLILPITLVGTGLLLAPNLADAKKTKQHRAKTAPNNTWITLSGTVVKTTPNAFALDYGKGIITVEMDDFDSYEEGRELMQDDEVVVYGVVDDDLFEKRSIEASSVYVKGLHTYFYASSADEEDFAAWSMSPRISGDVELTGVVTSKKGREFTIISGPHAFQIDTASMSFNPMDDYGFLQVDIGDKVKVSGEVDDKLWDEPEISADWIVKLR